jgi:chromosome segregation ATPase
LKNAEKQFEAAKKDYKAAINEVHQLKKQADMEAPLHDEDGNDTPLKAQLEALGVDTLPEALAALEEAEQKIESIEADHNAVRAYQRNKQETEDVRAQLDDLNSSEDQKKRDLEEKVRPWEQALSNAVLKVNIKFSKYMAEMGCTGR